jgi:diguanylate cyclase (GGDEF)-like protein
MDQAHEPSRTRNGQLDLVRHPDLAAEHRDHSADDRDARADAHDTESSARDERSTARDARAVTRELAADGQTDAGAAADRLAALRDRYSGAGDRDQSAHDREASRADRDSAANDRQIAWTDELTGAYRREIGICLLEREFARAKRTGQPFTLAFVDVDNLKGTNDTHGHAAGDARLRATAGSIQARLRSYDLVVRVGGDEFLCGLLDVPLDEAAKRFRLVDTDLAAAHPGSSITPGLAELQADDALEDLIARADAAMYAARKRLAS